MTEPPAISGAATRPGGRRGPVGTKAATFGESVIREMTRLCLEHDNLAQGFPDFPCPAELKAAAKAAIDADLNQYAITWGAPELRHDIAAKVARTYPRGRLIPSGRCASPAARPRP